MLKLKSIFTLLFFLFHLEAYTQTMTGLWRVTDVHVGDRNLTPVAKWFRYKADHTYEAGNGWTQNDIGTWDFDKVKSEFTPTSTMRLNDEGFGAFKVTFQDDKMTWQRDENGMPVVVSLAKIEKIPMAPKDSIANVWELKRVEENGRDITKTYDPDNKELLLIQNMQTFRKTNPDGSQAFGYWHMDAHHPELHLIDYDRRKKVQVYTVSFTDDWLRMKPKDNPEIAYFYQQE